MKKYLIFFFVLLQSILSLRAEDCAPYIGSCDYYLCREKEHSCGKKGYYLGFAYKYCKKAEHKLVRRMSERGKNWSRDVALCLQQSVERIPYDENCHDAKKSAVNDHRECYRDTGFCELSKRDRFNVIRVVSTGLRHPQVIKEGLAIINECRKY